MQEIPRKTFGFSTKRRIQFCLFGGLFTMVSAFGVKGPPNDMLTLVLIGSISLLFVGFGMAVREFRTMK